jgi:site-specific recombinase XerD
MTKRNAENERIKRRYLVYLKDAKGRDNASVDAAASAIERFEEYVKRRDVRSFHIEQARGFKAHLMAATNGRTDKPLSASTVHATLAGLKAFFVWLADQRGYGSRIKYADAEYFNTSDNLSRIATAAVQELPDARAASRDDRGHGAVATAGENQGRRCS